MVNSKTLPDWGYAIATSVCTVATFAILWPRHMDTNAIVLLLSTVSIAATLSIASGIYIRKHIKIGSGFLDLIEVCAIPVYMYLSLRLVGYSMCLKCISMATAVCLIYIALLIKINVMDCNKTGNRRYLYKVIATGLYNMRFIVLMILVAQMLITHRSIEEDNRYYLQNADVRSCICVKEKYYYRSDPIGAEIEIERNSHGTQTY